MPYIIKIMRYLYIYLYTVNWTAVCIQYRLVDFHTQVWSLVWYYLQSHHWRLSCQLLGHGFGHRDGWGREGETCPCSSLVSYSMACMHVVSVILLLCVWMHFNLQHLSLIYSFRRGRRYDRTLFLPSQGKTFTQEMTLPQVTIFKFYMLFVLYSHRCCCYEGQNPLCM